MRSFRRNSKRVTAFLLVVVLSFVQYVSPYAQTYNNALAELEVQESVYVETETNVNLVSEGEYEIIESPSDIVSITNEAETGSVEVSEELDNEEESAESDEVESTEVSGEAEKETESTANPDETEKEST